MKPLALWFVLSSAALGPACGSASDDSLFDDGPSLAGGTSNTTGGAGASTSISASGGAGGVGVSGGAGGMGVGGNSGSIGTGGNPTGGTAGSEAGVVPEADAATGGVANVEMDASPTSGGTGGAGTIEDASSGGTGGVEGDAGTSPVGNGVECSGEQCEPGEKCCLTSSGDYCAPADDQCTCTGIACTTTTVTCDEPTDCGGDDFCCFTVVYSAIATRVSTLQCQPTCDNALTEYILCDPDGPDNCPSQLSCSTALLMTNLNACQ